MDDPLCDSGVSSDSSSSLRDSNAETKEATARKAFLSSFTYADHKRIMKKVNMRFLPLIGLMYFMKSLDQLNASMAKVMQVGEDRNILTELRMTHDEYNWVQSMYFVAYMIFEIPSNLMLKMVRPHNWQCRIMLSWGVVLACHAAAKNKQGIYATRFFLGMMEAGLFPGLATQLCSWYRSDEMALPITVMFALQGMSGVVASLLAYGVSYMNGLGGLSGWRWLYLLEGISAILISIIIYFVLPDYPKSARSRRWLEPHEQEYIEARLSENAPLTSDSRFTKSEIIESVRNPRTWVFMLALWFANIGGYGLQWQLPSITTSLGFTELPRNQLLNIPPAAAIVISVIFTGWFLDKAYITRPAYVMILMAGMSIFFLLLALPIGRGLIYSCCVMGIMFNTVWYIPFLAWRSSTLIGTTGSAFTIALQTCLAQSGGIIGPQLFTSRFAHNQYKTSFAICAGAIAGAYIMCIWSWWLTRNIEWDVMRIRRLRAKSEKEGKVYAEDDIKVFEERQFYKGLRVRGGSATV